MWNFRIILINERMTLKLMSLIVFGILWNWKSRYLHCVSHCWSLEYEYMYIYRLWKQPRLKNTIICNISTISRSLYHLWMFWKGKSYYLHFSMNSDSWITIIIHVSNVLERKMILFAHFKHCWTQSKILNYIWNIPEEWILYFQYLDEF